MRRREFITLLGSMVVAWPLTARAQQRERVRRVGVLMPFTADDHEGQARLLAFAQGLQQKGWAIGSSLRIDARWGAGVPARPSQRRPISPSLTKKPPIEDRGLKAFCGRSRRPRGVLPPGLFFMSISCSI
jgi:hypothetical protein